MTVTAISLTDPVSGLTVPIMPRPGVAAQALDASAPARAVAEDKVGGHGTYDTTRFNAAGAVSLSMLLYPGDDGSQAEGFLDALAQLLDPGLRPVLVVTDDQWATPRQIVVRYDSTSKPLSDPASWPVLVSWAAPKAVWEAVTPTQAFAGAYQPSSTGLIITSAGLVVSPAGIVMPPTTAPPGTQTVNTGSAPANWRAFCYGPCTGPRLANDTAGLAVEFLPNLVLGAGEYVLLDSYTQTALRNGDPAQSLKSYLNFTTLGWWLMRAGLNTLRYYPVTAAAGSQAVVSYSPAWPL